MILVNHDSSEPYYRQIYQQVIEAIETGVYRRGDRLPSIRKFASDLGVSRNTIVQAYLLLEQEGYIDARPGSGYYINHPETMRQQSQPFGKDYEAAMEELLERQRSLRKDEDYAFDFAYDRMDADSFPYVRWSRIARDVLLDVRRTDICGYGDKQGLPELREQIAIYLAKEQDIVARPEQVVLLPTTRRAFSSILHLFSREDTVVYFDDPSYPEAFNAAKKAGYQVRPHRVFPEFTWSDLQVSPVDEHKTKLVYTTPANQYPTNAVMGLDERKSLVRWAAKHDAYLVEDEYCHEFRYGSPHLPSLHALDEEGRVITMGTFSKSLAPSICLSYLVLPPKLMLRWLAPHGMMHTQVPWYTQRILAEFMREDLWYAHLRRLQTIYRRKHDALVDALNRHMGDRVDCLQQDVGLHVLVRTKDPRSAEELVALAAANGVRVYPTAHTWVEGAPTEWDYVLVGYSAIPLEAIDEGVRHLAEAWFA